TTFIYHLFFLIIRRPPRSTLFPYTNALPICRADRVAHGMVVGPAQRPGPRIEREEESIVVHEGEIVAKAGPLAVYRDPPEDPGRSEEHTSELQSRGHLVCRLLLEKKKTEDSI